MGGQLDGLIPFWQPANCTYWFNSHEIMYLANKLPPLSLRKVFTGCTQTFRVQRAPSNIASCWWYTRRGQYRCWWEQPQPCTKRTTALRRVAWLLLDAAAASYLSFHQLTHLSPRIFIPAAKAEKNEGRTSAADCWVLNPADNLNNMISMERCCCGCAAAAEPSGVICGHAPRPPQARGRTIHAQHSASARNSFSGQYDEVYGPEYAVLPRHGQLPGRHARQWLIYQRDQAAWRQIRWYGVSPV